jgi:murein DD-endopeptidase MepM/ murein hydrolase activator NlpD
MRRGTKVVAVCALVTSFLLVSSVPANAQLQQLVDLIFPKPVPPPVEPVPAPAPASAPAPAPAAAAAKPAPAARQPFTIPVPKIRRSPARSTAVLFERLRSVVEKGLPIDKAILKVASPFPVAGPAKFSHDWGFPRYTPTPHLHKGTDVFAAFGTPIVTSESGRIIKKGTAGAGGISVWVKGDGGNAYYYAHLQSWVRGLTVGQRVERGAIIGFVGDTGNAEGGSPHLHFEIHPGGAPGSPARDPKPFLDDALRQAENNALLLAREGGVIDFTGDQPTRFRTIVVTKKVDKLLQAASMQGPEDLMWYSMLDPTLGVLGLARQSAAGAGLPASALSAADAREEERLDAVRTAVSLPKTKMEGFVHDALFKDEAVVVGPVGLALAASPGDPATP